MFKSQNSEEGFKKIETIIGPSVKVKGDFNSHGNIIVEGIVEGTLKTKGNLRVGSQAKITADVEAKEAKISGEVTGNLKIKGYLELSATAKVTGDIEAVSMSIERGAILNGKCAMPAEEKGKHHEAEKQES